MAVYYRKKVNEAKYVSATKELNARTKHFATKMPRKWKDYFLTPWVEAAIELENLILSANSVYISHNASNEEQIKAYSIRLDYLVKAMRQYQIYEARFDELLQNIIDINEDGYKIKHLIEKCIQRANEENETNIKIDVHYNPTQMEYIATSGENKTKMSFTTKNKEALISCANEAYEEIKKAHGICKNKIDTMRISA